MSEAGVHRPHVGGIHGRSNDGSYSLVLAGGFEDEVVSFMSSTLCCVCLLIGLITCIHVAGRTIRCYNLTGFVIIQ